jgi:hypothetical protein
LNSLTRTAATEQDLNMEWAEENATFTGFLNSPSPQAGHHESGEFAESESTIYSESTENTFCSESGSLLDGVNEGSDYLFTLNDSFTVPQVDYSSESFPSQWPFFPPGRSSDCYPPPKFAMATTLLPEFSNELPVILNQDDLIFNISANIGLEVLNLPFLEADLGCFTQKMAISPTPLTFTSQKIRQK